MERYDFKTQRLFVANALSVGSLIEAERAQANYLLNVLRLKSGSKILLFNGLDGEFLAEIEQDGKKSCKLKVVQQLRPQPLAYDLVYCFAPLKQGRLDYMVQKAVEMGAGVLQPVLTHHTQISKINLERLQSNIVEAAEQCGILQVPVCKPPVKLDELLKDWDHDRQIIFADEGAMDLNPITSLKALGKQKLAILIGPEGGFSPTERQILLNKSFVTPISLGPRILRADTAAVAALAIVQATLGDWH